MAAIVVNAAVSAAINGRHSARGHQDVADVDCDFPDAHKYRGAVVEDLQLPPAFTLPETESIGCAFAHAYERDFSHIPTEGFAQLCRILSKERKPVGYLDVPALKIACEAGKAKMSDNVLKRMSPYERIPSRPYKLITPDTPLDELEAFLRKNQFAIVTDYDRKFVLAVATLQDLDNFVSRRGF